MHHSNSWIRGIVSIALWSLCALASGHNNNLVSVGHDSHLASGDKADSVVSILGSSASEGDAREVVSILGNTRVTGPVKDNAVAVLGSIYVNSSVSGDVVAVLGDVELGPDAQVGGDVVSVGGAVLRDPNAMIYGSVQNVLATSAGTFGWLRPWVSHCLIYGRPLALTPGIGWAWGLALGFLALYVLLATMFRTSVDRCIHTLETQPGHTVLAALLALLAVPLLLVLLCVTVIGIAAVPFVVFGLFCAVLFGKAVMLAWIGKRVAGNPAGPLSHPALTVLIGGTVVLVLYLVPLVGFVMYKLLDLLGLGVVAYTLIELARTRAAIKAVNAQPAGLPASSPDLASRDPSVTPEVPPAAASTPAPAEASPAAPPPAAAPSAIGASSTRAGFWIRMGALLIDVLVVGFVMSVLHHLLNLELLALAVYGAAMWKLRGSTIGGIVFDLQVVRLDGREIDWATAVVRALGCFLSLAVAGLGFIWIAFDESKQAWHDKIAGTVVVRVPRGVPLVR
jgi:uncharacterized RDD family membrane protein YckC